MGADDYIKKPFSQRLLVERIRALLRRGELQQDTGDAEPVIQRGELTLDPSRHQCGWKGQNVDLTVTEFLILKSLALRPGHVKSRDQLMDGAYGEHIYVDDRTIDSHIKRLRKKFKIIDPDFAQIEPCMASGTVTATRSEQGPRIAETAPRRGGRASRFAAPHHRPVATHTSVSSASISWRLPCSASCCCSSATIRRVWSRRRSPRSRPRLRCSPPRWAKAP